MNVPAVSPDFSITVLGSGTCTPHPTRGCAGYLVQYRGRSFLMDSGSGTVDRLIRHGIIPHDLDGIFYTHLHLDHTADLFPLLFSLRNSGEFKRNRDIKIHGPPGFRAFYDHLAQVYGRWVLSSSYAIKVHEIAPGHGVDLGDGLQVSAHTMRHSKPAVGYRFIAQGPSDAQERVIAFTGDADDGPEMQKLIHDADIAVFDCSTPDDAKIPGHLTPTEIARLARESGVKRIVLSHFYPPLSHDPQPAVAQVQGLSGLPTDAAFDGAQYGLKCDEAPGP